MSRQMVAVFFPASDALVVQHMPSFYDRYMPSECSPAVWPFAYWTLLPLCLMGLICGLWGYLRVNQSSYKKGFLYFACMNLTAAACHCFTPVSSPIKPLMAALDVGFTCCTSICLSLGALTSGARPVSKQKLYNQLAMWLPSIALAVAVIGNHVGPLHPDTGLRSVPFLNELMYILITLLAALLLFLREVLRPALTAQQRGAIMASAVTFIPVPFLLGLNPYFCQLPLGFDITHVLFLGCNLSIYFLSRYLQLQEAGTSRGSKVD